MNKLFWVDFMNLLKDQIECYYKDYDEDRRLVKDNSHSIEFLTTTKYINDYIAKGSKILEIGAATGRYAFYYLEKSCEVTALDISQKHVDIMKEKAKSYEEDIKVLQGNALDLSGFEDNSYDLILCFGPMYHLTKEADRMKCIKESLRVLKPGGIIAVAYISKFAHFIDMINRNEDIADKGLQNIVKNGVELGDDSDCFYFTSYDYIEKLMSDSKIDKVKHIATDGIADMLRQKINTFTKEEFNLWMDYHFKTCENPTTIGYSKHNLYIGRKV